MTSLLGEYECKVDAKGRFMLPSGLKKQMAELVHEGFVINRDIFEKCLILYPLSEWKKVSSELSRLSRFKAKNVLFIRKFNNGATPIELDGIGRILIPKSLMKDAQIEKEIKVTGNGERIEIWNKELYEAMLNEDVDFGQLAEEVMGGLDKGASDELS